MNTQPTPIRPVPLNRWRMFEPPDHVPDAGNMVRFPDPQEDPKFWEISDEVQRRRLVLKVGNGKKERGNR